MRTFHNHMDGIELSKIRLIGEKAARMAQTCRLAWCGHTGTAPCPPGRHYVSGAGPLLRQFDRRRRPLERTLSAFGHCAFGQRHPAARRQAGLSCRTCCRPRRHARSSPFAASRPRPGLCPVLRLFRPRHRPGRSLTPTAKKRRSHGTDHDCDAPFCPPDGCGLCDELGTPRRGQAAAQRMKSNSRYFGNVHIRSSTMSSSLSM